MWIKWWLLVYFSLYPSVFFFEKEDEASCNYYCSKKQTSYRLRNICDGTDCCLWMLHCPVREASVMIVTPSQLEFGRMQQSLFPARQNPTLCPISQDSTLSNTANYRMWFYDTSAEKIYDSGLPARKQLMWCVAKREMGGRSSISLPLSYRCNQELFTWR